MLASDTASLPTGEPRQAHEFDPHMRSLLDHVAVELAAEYVRLMEAAAEAEATRPRDETQDAR